MSLLIYAGLLYLMGISAILILKPELMFAKDGSWKEFGLGRNKQKYTWMPFWLFAILWSIISYIIVLVIASNTGLGGVSNNIDVPVQNNSIEPENVSMKAMSPVLPDNMSRKKPSSPNEMKPGYYILDANETVKRGVPKYIFLGPEAPNLVYHNMNDKGESNGDNE
uniref:Uncharacterized protein n=1 Tax=viral metagenome TaxID=1070528 RepID=A0A6C0DTK9_9ZZZZ